MNPASRMSPFALEDAVMLGVIVLAVSACVAAFSGGDAALPLPAAEVNALTVQAPGRMPVADPLSQRCLRLAEIRAQHVLRVHAATAEQPTTAQVIPQTVDVRMATGASLSRGIQPSCDCDSGGGGPRQTTPPASHQR